MTSQSSSNVHRLGPINTHCRRLLSLSCLLLCGLNLSCAMDSDEEETFGGRSSNPPKFGTSSKPTPFPSTGYPQYSAPLGDEYTRPNPYQLPTYEPLPFLAQLWGVWLHKVRESRESFVAALIGCIYLGILFVLKATRTFEAWMKRNASATLGVYAAVSFIMNFVPALRTQTGIYRFHATSAKGLILISDTFTFVLFAIYIGNLASILISRCVEKVDNWIKTGRRRYGLPDSALPEELTIDGGSSDEESEKRKGKGKGKKKRLDDDDDEEE